MAIIIRGKTTCAICNLVIRHNDLIIATSHFIRNKQDPLYRFSDAAFHESCFLSWEQREVFIKRFNQIVGSLEMHDGLHLHMESNGKIIKS